MKGVKETMIGCALLIAGVVLYSAAGSDSAQELLGIGSSVVGIVLMYLGYRTGD